MALFELKSKITIAGRYVITGVHEVRIKKSLTHLQQACSVKLPSIGYIKKGNAGQELNLGTVVQPGDTIKVELAYKGYLQEPDWKTEFEGFVRFVQQGMPLELECEGYERQLRLSTNIKKHFKDETVKSAMDFILQGTDIKALVAVDFKIGMFKTIAGANALHVINFMKQISMGALRVFFIEPKVLFVGVCDTEYLAGRKVFDLPKVSYRFGYNCIRDNQLRQKAAKEPADVLLQSQLLNGTAVRTEANEKQAKRQIRHYNTFVRDVECLKVFAKEIRDRNNYIGYDGYLTGFLQPYCQPGYTAEVIDSRYPDKNGEYLVESTEVIFGINGARRRINIGVQIKK